MIPDGSTLVVFAVAAFVLLITPGPAVFYIVARSIDQGRIAGIVSTLGVGAGALVHVGAAALGVSALLLSSALAFNILK
ncbi:MAG: LysE family transporter, partial [Acidiferrobacterales bacterium]|nr:LysE family transporter [Acidiferrobacterales bacterium]